MTWFGAAIMGAIIMSPASGLYFNFTGTEAAAGKVVPLVFLIAMVVTLPTAFSYASLSSSLPSAGSAYTWMRAAITPEAGVFVGWVLNGFYLLAQIVLPGMGALFFNEILRLFGLRTNFFTWAVGVVLLVLVVVALNFKGIDLSLKGTVILMVVESAVVLALMITIFVVQGNNGQFSASDAWSTFKPSSAMGGSTALFGALIFGIQANVGFDAVASVAEETKTPKKFIPIATLLAVIGVGIYWIVTAIGFVAAMPIEQVAEIAARGETPVAQIADNFWGFGGQIIISVVAFVSIAAIFLAQNVASSRALYGMARHGAAPAWLGKLNPGTAVPRNAMALGLGVTLIVTLILGALLGTSNQYTWSATMSSGLALLTYLSVNIANIVYHWRKRRSEFNWFAHGIIPAIGIVVVCFVLYKSYLGSLWESGWTYGQSVQLAIVIWLVLGVVWVLYLKKRNPSVFDKAHDLAAEQSAGWGA